MKKFIFWDNEKETELVLPVTPAGFEVSHGIRIETINVHTVGDVNIAGYETLASIRIECMFPAKSYPFAVRASGIMPYQYVDYFRQWADNRTVLNFIVSDIRYEPDTMVNIKVLVEGISYGERDGTGDVYAMISLREYRVLLPQSVEETKNEPRETPENTTMTNPYTIRPGDTLTSICRERYGDASLYLKVAKFNNIQNPNLIIAGRQLNLPDRSQL